MQSCNQHNAGGAEYKEKRPLVSWRSHKRPFIYRGPEQRKRTADVPHDPNGNGKSNFRFL